MAKFKVGDRVKLIFSGAYNGNGDCGKTGEHGTVVRYEEYDDTYKVKFDESGCWWAKAGNLNLLPATLTIEAGRYYKTRDGRKVGPMRSDAKGWLYTHIDGIARSFRVDGGKHQSDSNLDLVAEWQEPATNDNAPKFKVGDLVARPGHLDGTIVGIDGDRARVDYGGHWGVWSWNLSEIDHYPRKAETISTTTPAIVCLIENGQPKPSDFPHVHPSKDAAAKEASRLAGKHKGKQFGVYELVSTVQQPAPVYEHEWQRLAAGGHKVLAIKELRARTGMHLATAHDAVDDWLRRVA